MADPNKNQFQNFEMNRNLSTVFEDPKENERTTAMLEQTANSYTTHREMLEANQISGD